MSENEIIENDRYWSKYRSYMIYLWTRFLICPFVFVNQKLGQSDNFHLSYRRRKQKNIMIYIHTDLRLSPLELNYLLRKKWSRLIDIDRKILILHDPSLNLVLFMSLSTRNPKMKFFGSFLLYVKKITIYDDRYWSKYRSYTTHLRTRSSFCNFVLVYENWS